jgi:aspartyl-tRNA(Asn)/glutamyl-tRNA(Gln) amidotransferase subunit B
VLDYGMTEYDAGVLTAETASAAYFEAVASGRDGKAAANWVINELFGRLNREGHGIEESPIGPDQLGGLLDLVASGEISGKIAKDLFEILWTEGGDPATLVAERGLRQVTDTSAIEAAVAEVVAANSEKAVQALAKPALAGWFVGQVMKATGGKANPQAVQAEVRRQLGLE